MKRIFRSFHPILVLILLLIHGGCKEEFVQGRRLYEGNCAGCHMHDGTGLADITPPLYESDYLKANIMQLPCIIRYGLFDTILVNRIIFTDFMLGYPKLTDAEVSNICNYIAYRFLQDPTPSFSPRMVKALTDSCRAHQHHPSMPLLRDSVRMFQSI